MAMKCYANGLATQLDFLQIKVILFCILNTHFIFLWEKNPIFII